jgi:sporulation protein YabP
MQSGGETRNGEGHSLTLTDRKRLSLTGVEDVDCFNEQIVVVRTPLGTLSVAGAGLNISQLSLESGRVDIEGDVEALEYSGGKRGGGLLGRLFR